MFDDGIGYRSIATMLEREGHPSPGEIGPVRHPRSAGVWGGSVVRSILTNPRYLGHQVVGRQRRKDELLDPRDPAAGTTSKQHWQVPDEWVMSDEPTWPALADRELWERVNEQIKNTRGPGRRRPRAVEGKYVLAGVVRCAACGRSMHGATLKSKPYYRCNAQRPDYADTSAHPRTTAVREERILDAVDKWLNQLADSKHCDATIASVLTADGAGPLEPPEAAALGALSPTSRSSSIGCSPLSAQAWMRISLRRRRSRSSSTSPSLEAPSPCGSTSTPRCAP